MDSSRDAAFSLWPGASQRRRRSERIDPQSCRLPRKRWTKGRDLAPGGSTYTSGRPATSAINW